MAKIANPFPAFHVVSFAPNVPCDSTCVKDVSKMVKALPDVEIKEIHEAMVGVMKRMKANLLAEGILPDNLPKRA